MFKITVLKKIFRLISLIFLILFLFFAPIVILPQIENMQNNLFMAEKLQEGEVLELWNVESFEGGSGSRGKFLEKIALEFEQQNKGSFIVVKTLSVEQAILNLEQNNMPNIVSFGIGFGEHIAPYLTRLSSGYAVDDKFIKAGTDGMNFKAVAFCYSGYFFIQNGQVNNNITGYGGADLTNPLQALQGDYHFYKDCENLTGYDAYDKFVQNKFQFLVGTARDFFRCRNRENNNSMENNIYTPLDKYTDLVQYLGVVKGTNNQKIIAEEYIKTVLEKENQQKLISIGMFSTVLNDIYSSGSLYSEMEKVFCNITNILNVFYDIEHITEFKQKALTKLT